ncbi:MAG: hypothetical protein GY711_02440 [bacterium]|nr:hypothetical protein [bacterium]
MGVQTPIYEIHGNSAGDQFGFSVSDAGDVNADGLPDVIIGSFDESIHGPDTGAARVYSGADGAPLLTLFGDSGYDYFGLSVSGAGDVNRDGHDDLIVGAIYDDNTGANTGSARVCSGADGSTLYTFDGDTPDGQFGISVSGAGDVNADGHADLIVGAPKDDGAGVNSGSATVYSGSDGSVLYAIEGDLGAEAGYSVCDAGDVDGDGFDDFAVGARGERTNGWAAGSVTVFSGQDGSVLHRWFGDYTYHALGSSLSNAGDVNGDGVPDLISGQHRDHTGGTYAGHARVFSGADGSTLYDFYGEEGQTLGHSVSDAGDVDGDGFGDLVVGMPGAEAHGYHTGAARVFSGVDGRILYTVDGYSAGDELGHSVSGAGNVDGVGFDDLVLGVRGDDDAGDHAGSVRVVVGRDSIGESFCGPAASNSTGHPARIRAVGSPFIIDDLTLVADQLPPGQFGYFLVGQTEGSLVPPGSQGTLCLAGNIGRYNRIEHLIQGPAGALRLDPWSVPVNPAVAIQPGETWLFQCWYRDQSIGPVSNFTDGLRVTFGALPAPAVEFAWASQHRWEWETQLVVRIDLSAAADLPVSVTYAEAGTATPHVDYRVESTNPVVIPVGQTSVDLCITVADDSVTEPDETVILTLQQVDNGHLGLQIEHVLTIRDND